MVCGPVLYHGLCVLLWRVPSTALFPPMGNLCSGPPPAKAPSKGAQGGGGGGGGNFGRDPNLNPEDFMVKNREGEFVVRPPGFVPPRCPAPSRRASATSYHHAPDPWRASSF